MVAKKGGGKGIDPKATGPGAYRFLVGDALLECRKQLYNEENFATACEWAMAISEDIIQKHRKWWNKALVAAFLDEKGQALVDAEGKWIRKNVDVPKSSQYKRIAALTVLLRKSGVLDSKAQKYEDATGFFSEVLEERGGDDKDPNADDEDEDDDDEED